MTLWTHLEAEAATCGQASRAFSVSGISIDTRTLKEGDLFVALEGDNRDGHDFVRAAFDAKAAAAMVARAPSGATGPLLTVGHTQRGLEDLARVARARSNAKILAVTGSAGKTTTKEILRLACDALGRTHASAASYNNHWGVPLSLALLPRDAEYGIFEVGMNHFGELRNLVSFVKPHVALITTIAPAHLEFFGTCEAIADAKSEIFEGLTPGGAALIPSDSPYAERLKARARQAQVSRIVSFGSSGDARLVSFACEGEGMRVKADILGRAVDCYVGAPGAHIARNVVGALAAVAVLDGNVLNAAAALKNFVPLKGRGARFEAGGVQVIDESYNANPASMAAALALLGNAPSSNKNGRRIAVLGDMLEMGESSTAHHAGLAQPIEANKVDLVFASGSQMKALWDALPASRRGAYAENAAGLAPKVMAAVKAGDTVLVKGSNGAKMTVIVEALKGESGLMLYYLSLLTHTDQLAFFRLFKYLTFRTLAAVVTALLIAFLFNPMLIRWLKVKQGKGQPIRSDGPQRHIIEKAGTPTMGGLLILIPWVGATLLWANLSNRYVWIALLVTASYGLLGFLDDYYKVTKRTSDGLSSRMRLLIEFAVAALATVLIMRSEPAALSGVLAVPFIKTALLPLGLFFIAVGVFVIAGAANAVNFTDGLDGLAIMPVMIAAAAFTLIVYLVGNERFSAYLQIPYIEYSGELTVFLAALVGAGLGFLWYNAPPAAIFMGDTGSLPLGGALGVVAVAVKHEIVLGLVGGLFVLETVSVMVQVISFKLTGKRVFRMAPIHHHYEQLGWTEPTIVIRFWIVAVVLALLGLATLKLR